MAKAKRAKSFTTGGSVRRPKITTSNITVGRPGFIPGVTRRADTGQKVPPDTAGAVQTPTRVMKYDPAKSSALIGTNKDVPILGTVKPSVAASVETNLAGNNNDLHFDARVPGTAGNAITVAYVDPGGVSATLGVVVAGNAVTVNLGRAASAINSTAQNVMDAIKATPTAMALINPSLKSGNDGTGLVIALAATNLAGGTAPVTTAALAVNTVAVPNPTVISGPSFIRNNAQPTGQIKIQAGLNRNRGVRITKNN